jgi:hypothetical protein
MYEVAAAAAAAAVLVVDGKTGHFGMHSRPCCRFETEFDAGNHKLTFIALYQVALVQFSRDLAQRRRARSLLKSEAFC